MADSSTRRDTRTLPLTCSRPGSRATCRVGWEATVRPGCVGEATLLLNQNTTAQTSAHHFGDVGPRQDALQPHPLGLELSPQRQAAPAAVALGRLNEPPHDVGRLALRQSLLPQKREQRSLRARLVPLLAAAARLVREQRLRQLGACLLGGQVLGRADELDGLFEREGHRVVCTAAAFGAAAPRVAGERGVRSPGALPGCDHYMYVSRSKAG
jgi:hypothetical protein